MDNSYRYWWKSSHFLMCILTGLLFLLMGCTTTSAVSVMSVDFGSEWMKVAIVSPGVPMEIALNKESKRKTPVAVAFRNGERTFGEDALTVGIRSPKECYWYFVDLLGKTVDNPVVKRFQELFPYYDIVPDPERNTVLFQHDEKTTYSVEELVGMMLYKAKEMAELAAGQSITDAVLTVPGYFGQDERHAFLQAAKLASLNPLQLINDYTAAALNYGIFRMKDFNDTAQYFVLYDMGAWSTTAVVVSYQTVKVKERGFVETHPQMSVLGVGFDRTLGGLEMQLRMRNHLAAKFNEMKKTKKDVTKNSRSMSKLFKEAGRVKNVLSANVDHTAQIEGLIDEIDFKVQVTRTEFEDMCSDLLARVMAPVQKALNSSHLSMDVMSQVLLVGAGTRMPAVQERLKSLGTLGKSLNTDEASVMGASYKAADLSKGFKVKKFITRDAVVYPIQVMFEREGESGNVKQVKRTLFGLMNAYPQKKIMTFNKQRQDFVFSIALSDLDHISPSDVKSLGDLTLSEVSLKGVTAAMTKHAVNGGEVDYKGVKAHFQLDESGLLSLNSVELLLEKPGDSDMEEPSTLSKLGSSISNFFSSSSNSEEAGKSKTVEEGKGGESSSAEEETKKKVADDVKETNKSSNVTGNKTESGENKTEKEPAKPKVVVIKEDIEFDLAKSGELSMNKAQLELSTNKLGDLNNEDLAKSRREGALNSLESSVFETRSRLETVEYRSAVSDDEFKTILELCDKVGTWLEESGWEADVTELEARLSEMRKATSAAWGRVKEHQDRPEALRTLEVTLIRSVSFLANVSNTTTDPPVFTPTELQSLEKVINEVTDWKEKIVEEQKKTPLYEQPKLTVRLIHEKMALLEREVRYLINKAKLWQPRPKDPVTEEKPKEANKTESKNETNSGYKVVEEPEDTSPKAVNATESKPNQTEEVRPTYEEEKEKHSEL